MASSTAYSTLFSNKAHKEVLASWSWYEERQQGLGDRFLEEIQLKIQKIQENPEQFAAKYKYYRETAVSIFPVLIIYKIDKKSKLIRIISVFHTARNVKKKYT